MRILLAVTILLLTACAGPHTIGEDAPDPQRWQAHKQNVADLQRWTISGRVAISTPHNGGHVDLFWKQHNDDEYDIRLVAPFGGGSSLIQGRGDGVLLTTSEGRQLYEADIDTLMAQIPDMPFPVSGLRYWLLGVPAPDSRSRISSWTEQGLVYALEQDGWRVVMRSYTRVEGRRLPNKLFIKRANGDEVDVRLVIRQWSLQ